MNSDGAGLGESASLAPSWPSHAPSEFTFTLFRLPFVLQAEYLATRDSGGSAEGYYYFPRIVSIFYKHPEIQSIIDTRGSASILLNAIRL